MVNNALGGFRNHRFCLREASVHLDLNRFQRAGAHGHGFREMAAGDMLFAIKVCKRAPDLQDAMESPGRQFQLLRRLPQKRSTLGIGPGDLFDQCGRRGGIGADIRRAKGFEPRLLDGARPLSEALYGLLLEGQAMASPEQRAAARNRLVAAAATISDRALASEYRQALLNRFFAATRRQPGRAAAAAHAALPGGAQGGGCGAPVVLP